MHHGPNDFEDDLTDEMLDDLLPDEQEAEEYDTAGEDENPDFGATGAYPEGKLTSSDEGEIRLGITTYEGKVVMNFGEEMGWVAFSPNQARNISKLLKKHARKARFS